GLVGAACSSSDSASVAPPDDSSFYGGEDVQQMTDGDGADTGAPYTEEATRDKAAFPTVASNTAYETKVIRDGRIDLRIEAGTFDSKGGELRGIAADLGGYVASGESHIEEVDDARYAVGWFTMRVPSDRFDDAVARVEALGVRVASSLSSQDVTEEYVDLEGRLDYWRQQEAFYTRLLEEATTIDDLVTLQTRMQDVLLNIEQIEGRLRYLDGRTSFATLTVGLTERPDEIAPVPAPTEPGPIEEAFAQAGDVLLQTVAFLIVAAAVVIPLTVLVMLMWLVVRWLLPKRRTPITPEN
ncbi:MAG: DUF4349 domain-containing protein, partial [Acidimicrobiia bacterium]|nr:DUF4349 domain-containing protein [Acidimicrobiia bacterium]